jgi:hypothetical protein
MTGNVMLIGCGGTGGWAARLLVASLEAGSELWLIDGDKYEAHNRDRQFCRDRDAGRFKAACMALNLRPLADRRGVQLVERLGYAPDVLASDFTDTKQRIYLCAADNHRARKATLELAEAHGGFAIIAGNEYETAEAYVYTPDWMGTPLDPRTYYPVIAIDGSNDPLRPACTGVEADHHPQLALANMQAATYAVWLMRYWMEIHPTLTDDLARERAPVHIRSTFGNVEVKQVRNY